MYRCQILAGRQKFSHRPAIFGRRLLTAAPTSRHGSFRRSEGVSLPRGALCRPFRSHSLGAALSHSSAAFGPISELLLRGAAMAAVAGGEFLTCGAASTSFGDRGTPSRSGGRAAVRIRGRVRVEASPFLTGEAPSSLRSSSSSSRKGLSNAKISRCSPQFPAHLVRNVATEEAVAAPRFSSQERVDILSEALPFIQRFHGKIVVVKYGGAAMKDGSLKEGVIKDLVLLSCVGLRPVLVHGGGPEINTWLTKIGIEPQFRNGLRVTDGPTMEVVEMVLVGKVNKSLVSLINGAGGSAVGMCGKDGKLITARPAAEDLGFVGDIARIDTTVLQSLLRDGHIPVVASVAADDRGQAYNINADTAAGEIAASLGAEKLILMTDVPGVMLDPKVQDSLVKSVDIRGVRKLIGDGIVKGGMIPKVECCIRSLAQGVKATHIIDGRAPHSLLIEILTGEGGGTMITG